MTNIEVTSNNIKYNIERIHSIIYNRILTSYENILDFEYYLCDKNNWIVNANSFVKQVDNIIILHLHLKKDIDKIDNNTIDIDDYMDILFDSTEITDLLDCLSIVSKIIIFFIDNNNVSQELYDSLLLKDVETKHLKYNSTIKNINSIIKIFFSL